MLVHFYNWFDSLQEPKRFFVFIGIVFGWYIPFIIYALIDGTPHDLLKNILIVIGSLDLAAMALITLHRAFRK